ncbi:hypothetical protein DJ031_15245 [bacterium endosymbiont of Escarpia laminata]|nr:MAG: hypothetical protein DJ031_15245 [bacterium endosymbiont of Escarpia laminata]
MWRNPQAPHLTGDRLGRAPVSHWTQTLWFRFLARLLSVFLVFQGAPPLRLSLPEIDPFFLLGISTVQAQGVPEWLVSTVDANHEDRFIQEKIAQLGPGAGAAFAFVRDEIGYEAYTGSLRGARGTLWSDAGNSLDQASLLIALLRGQGIEARYVQGTLSDADAKVLVLSMFDPEILANAVGNIPERYPKADPGSDFGLIAKAKDHWWVELEDGTQLDPVFADGLARGTPTSTYFEVPDAQRHKVVIRLRAEFHNVLSNFTYQTPLEHSFSTPELYGKAVTLGHFVNSHQPPALIGGFKTYTYSPWLMVDDNDTDRNNNHLIRGDNYQEFFANLPPVLANSTLTRLTLEMETQDPGKEQELRTRDLLDRLGFAARHGMGPSQAVDSENPALTELDLVTLLITPGFVVPELVPSHQQAVLDLTDEGSALGPEIEVLINKDPAQITAQDKELVKDYNDLNRAMLIAEGGFLTTAFQLESDFAIRKMRDSHLTLAYYDSPRITLFRSRTIQDGVDSRLQMELDLRRNHIKALPYPGQNAFNRFTFNMSKGSWDSKLEHAIVERLLAAQNPDVRIAASPIAVFRAAKAQGIPLAVLTGPADITARLEGLEISNEAKARIASALREGRQVNVPETMVDLDGTPAIGWWEIDMKSGEIIAVSEDGGYQSMVEFVLILALVGFGSLFAIMAFSQRLTEFFEGNQNNTGNFDSSDFNKNSNIDPVWQQEIQGDQPIGARIITINVNGQDLILDSSVFDNMNVVLEAVGSEGSILDFTGTNVEVISLYAPGPSALSGQITTGAGITLETVPERAFEVKAQQACRVASAFRARLSNTGTDDTFTLTGAPPAGWNLLIARDESAIPAGAMGEVSFFLQPHLDTPLPAPGTSIPFSVTAARSDDPGGALTQNLDFVMPAAYCLVARVDPDSLYTTPSGDAQTDLILTNTGNIAQTLGLGLTAPNGFAVTGPGADPTLNPGGSVSRAITFTAQGLPLDSNHYARATANYGAGGEFLTEMTIRLHIAAPGSLQALHAATDADALGRPELAGTLETLGQDLSSLYQDLGSEPHKSRLLASLDSLSNQLDDPLLAPFAPDIDTARQAIADSTPATLETALDDLDTALTAFGEQLAALADHDFEVALRPNSAEALPQSPTVFRLYLKNRGTETTTYHLSLAGVPPGIDASLSQASLTLRSGFAIEPGVSGTHHLPIAIDVTLTQPADELTAFEFELVVTADGAPQVQRSTYGSFTARDELVSVLSVTSTPAFTDPGGSVDVTTRLLNALNRERDLLVSYRVKNAGGAEFFSSAPQAVQMSVLSSVATVALGAFDTSGLPLGSYTLEVSVTESDGTPLAGGSGSGTLLVGSPLNAALSVDPDSLPAGDGQAMVTLQIDSLVNYDANGIGLIGLTDTLGGGRSVAVRGDYAYLGGTEGVTVLNISTPQDPLIVHTFGSAGNNRTWIKGDYLLVANELDLTVYGLTDPEQPELLASAASGVTGTHASGLYVQGDLAFVNTIIFIWGNSIVGIRGDTIIYDLSDPLNPQSLGLFYNTPQGSYPQWPGSHYFIGESAVGKGGVVYLMSSSAENDAAGGTGRLRMLNVSDPQNVTEAGVFDLPGSVLLGGMAIQGNRALVVGTDGPFVLSGGSPSLSGQMTLHLLDVTDPLNPTILGSELLAGGGLYRLLLFTVRSVTDDLFVIEDIDLNGQAKLRLVDTSDPANLRVIDIDTASVVGGALFNSGLLYTASNSGLGVYDLGGLTGIPVTAQVQVPNDGSAVILPGSFNRVPDSTTPGAGFDTLQWNLSLQTGQLSHALNWQVQLDGLQPGEARNAALGAVVDFTAWGSAGSIELPAALVAVEQVVALTPESRTMRPGEESLYTVTLMNPAATAVTYALGLQGLPPEWVTLQASVEVPAAGSIDISLTVRADALASLGEHGFAVTAATAGGARGLAYSRLVLEGTAVIQAEIHGVVITLTPLQDTAGQGTGATYRVRIINTGNVTETYELTGQLPVGIQGVFGEASVTVAPGLDNYREVLLTLTAPSGTAAGGQNFDVTATSTGTSGVTDQAGGTLNVSGFGVDVALTALAARPDSTFLMRVTNTGQSQDTFGLSLGGVLAPAATLEITAVTLAAGASRDLTVTVIGIDFAYPGSLDLVVIATSRGDGNVQDRASAAIDIPQSQGLTLTLDPVEVELPGVGDGAFLVLVQNSGNSEDVYSAAITGTGGAISAASLDGLDGQPTQSIPSFRLPGLATGAILLNVSLSSFGEGTVDVTIHSQSNALISGTVTARLRTANQNPVADPGADRSVHLGDLVQLDGSNSTDPDLGPSPLAYAWSFIAVPPGSALDDQAIVGANTVSASFTPDLTGQYRVQLVVSDGLLSDAREVAFQVENQVPVADAGPDLSVLIGEALILNGSGSHDPDQDLIRYRWTLAQTPAGSVLVQDDIGNATTPEPSFTPDLAGLYELALVVTDGDLESNPDPIRISAYDADLPPQADAGSDRNALVGEQAILDGSGSYDPDAAPQPLTYRWTFASLPPGSALDDAAISNATSALASFLPDVAGTYSLDLEISDGLVQHSDRVSVHGYLVETPPNADAGDDTLAGKGIPVSLDAGASSDPDTPAQGLSYAWIFVSIPQGSALDNADISNANTATPGFTPDVEGRYVLRLTLSDGTGEDSDNVMVSAKAGTGGDVVGAGGGGFGWLELWLLLAWLGIAGALRGRRRFGQLPVALMLAFLVTGGGLSPRPAQADDGPWYMGVSVGASKSAADAAELDANLAALGYSTTSTLDDTDIGWKLFGGYQWNPNLAVEAALVDLGQVTSRISGNFGDLDAFVADVARVHPYSARGISASIVGELPVAQRFRLFGKVGLFFWDADIDARFEVGGQPISFDSKQGVDPVFGAGVKFHINKKTALRVEWERYEIDRDSVQLLSAGVEYRFP